MEQQTFYHSLMTKILGKRFILGITDVAQIMSKEQQFKNDQRYQKSYLRISQTIRNNTIAGGALSLSLSLSLTRYVPSKFSNFGLNRVIADLALLTICLFITTYGALMTNRNQIAKLKKELILSYDKDFLNHMAQLEIKFSIEEQNQIRGIFTQEEYKQWIENRYLHMV